MQGYKVAAIGYLVSLVDIIGIYLKKTEGFLSAYSRMQSPIEIAVNGRATMVVSPIELLTLHGYDNLQMQNGNHHAKPSYRVTPYYPPNGSPYSRDTRRYNGIHRNGHIQRKSS